MTVYITMYSDGGSVLIHDKATNTQYFIDHRTGSGTRGLVFVGSRTGELVRKFDAVEVARELRMWLTDWLAQQTDSPARRALNNNISDIVEQAAYDLENNYIKLYGEKEHVTNEQPIEVPRNHIRRNRIRKR